MFRRVDSKSGDFYFNYMKNTVIILKKTVFKPFGIVLKPVFMTLDVHLLCEI